MVLKKVLICIVNPPDNYDITLGTSPKNVCICEILKGPFDFIHSFTKKRDELVSKFPILKQELSQEGVFWISWPKGSSKVENDLNGKIIREIGLNNGLLDVNVCSIDKIWSELKFVRRLKERK